MADIKETIKALEDYEPYAEHFRAITVESSVLLAALELLKEQEDMGKELTDAIELIHKKNAKIIELKVLLKEQEPVKVIIHDEDEWYGFYAECPECACKWMMDFEKLKYCPHCRKAVKCDG